MKMVVPLAGRDGRFVEAFGTAKPLVEVDGKPLVRRAIDSLGFSLEQDFSELIFICHPDDVREFGLEEGLKEAFPYPHVSVTVLDGPTEGAACTVLTVKERIDSEEELIIYLADILFTSAVPLPQALREADREIAGIVPCFPSDNPKYSYLRTDERNWAVEVAEKRVISNNASAGLYYFRQGKDFIYAAERMIQDPAKKVRNAYFICPTYQELVERGDRIEPLKVRMDFPLGSPEEVVQYKDRVKK